MNAHLPDLPVLQDEDADHFAALANRRLLRERMRTAFIDRARRTSLRRRRWFQISEIEPDPVARERLIGLWRASIYSGDLTLNGKSQVLCVSASPLLQNYTLPPEFARGEHFNMIVPELWMSAPRWLEWFRQIGRAPPLWMPGAPPRLDGADVKVDALMPNIGCIEDAEKPSGQKTWKARPDFSLTAAETAVLNALNELWPHGQLEHKAKARDDLIENWLKVKTNYPLSSRTIQRALAKIYFA